MTKTTSYEISKKLKEAGFKCKSIFGWHVDGKECAPAYPLSPTTIGYFWSYDLETLLNALKQTGKRIMIVGKSDNWGINFNYEFNIYSKENESLADTAGKMWLLLKEKGII